MRRLTTRLDTGIKADAGSKRCHKAAYKSGGNPAANQTSAVSAQVGQYMNADIALGKLLFLSLNFVVLIEPTLFFTNDITSQQPKSLASHYGTENIMDQEDSRPITPGATRGTERMADDTLGPVSPSSPAEQRPSGSGESQQGLRPESTVAPRCGKCYATIQDPANLSECISGRKVCYKCAAGLKRCNSCHDYLDQGIIAKPGPYCNCYFCGECFNDFWRSGLTDRQDYPPRCCYRGVGLNLNNFEGIMEPEILARYNERHPEWTARLPIHCASCGMFMCDAYSRPTSTDPVTCYLCKLDTCAKCRQLMTLHTGDRCPQDPPSVDQDTGDYPTHRCPTCRGLVTKLVEMIDGVKVDAACDHLTCVICNTDLCANCGNTLHRCTSQFFDRYEVDSDEAQSDGGATSDDGTAEDIAEAMHMRVLSDAD